MFAKSANLRANLPSSLSAQHRRPRPIDLRHQNYRELFLFELDPDVIRDIRRHGSFSVPLGNSRFTTQVEEALGRKVGQVSHGRPRKISENEP